MALSFERSEHFEAVDYYIQLRIFVDDNVQQNEDVSPFSVVRRQGVGALRTNDICTTYLYIRSSTASRISEVRVSILQVRDYVT